MSSEYNGNILYVKDENGEWIPIPSIVGAPGPEGPQGEPGEDYILTPADIQEIAIIIENDLGNADIVGY